jgi:hypothetical protein
MTSSEPSELRTETTTTARRNGATTSSSSGTTPLLDPVKSDDHLPSNKNALMKLKSYLIALRVWSLSASIIPTILGR